MRPSLVLITTMAAFCTLPGRSCPAAEPTSADELLAKSIAYHDPQGTWTDGAFRLVLTVRRPDGTEAEKNVLLAPGHGRYELREVRDGHVIEQKLHGGECTFAINGATNLSDAQREEHGLTCERLTRWRNYHTYLWGLPMKLRDPGTIVDPEVRRTRFQDRDVDALHVTYEPGVGTDVWYVFLDPETHVLVGYEFFKDEEKRVGETIVLEGETAGGGLRLPKSRAWYRTQNDEYLGTDVLTSLARE